MTIVCATDFSDSSFSAVRVASTLAHRHNQPLWLVHVMPHSVLLRRGATRELAATEALLLEAAALASEGIVAQTAVLYGTLAPAVEQFCAEKGARLLVVGDSNHPPSRAPGWLDKFTFGVKTPLLVVRDPKPFAAWALGANPLKVMLALDHSWSSASARDWIKRLSEYGSLEVIAAHVWWPAEEYARRKLPVPEAGEAHTVLSHLLRAETEAALANLPPNVTHRVHLEIGVGHVGEQLLAMAAAEQVDVLVLGTHPNRGALAQMRSVSHQALELAPMSVACIPGPPAPSAPTGRARRVYDATLTAGPVGR